MPVLRSVVWPYTWERKEKNVTLVEKILIASGEESIINFVQVHRVLKFTEARFGRLKKNHRLRATASNVRLRIKDERNWIYYWQLSSEAFWEQNISFRTSYFLMIRYKHVTHIITLRKRVTRDTSQVETCVGGLEDAPKFDVSWSRRAQIPSFEIKHVQFSSSFRSLVFLVFFKGFRRLAKAEIRYFTRDRSAIKLSFNKQHSLVSAWRYTDRRDTLCYTLPGLSVFVSMLPVYAITDNGLIILFQRIFHFDSVYSFQNLGNQPFEFKLLGRNKLYCSL